MIKWMKALLIIIFLIITIIICLFPFYIMIISATRSSYDIKFSLSMLPGRELINNYNELMSLFNVWRGILNSFIVSAITCILAIYFSSLSGYVLSKLHFKGSNIIFKLIIFFFIMPDILSLIGYYNIVMYLKLLDTYIPLIIPSIFDGFIVIMTKQYCSITETGDITHAAQIDGYSHFSIFNKIIIPVIMPMLVCLGLFSFIGKWNEFILPSIIIFSKEKQTMPILIASTKMFTELDYGVKYTAILFSTIPLLLIFLFFSKKAIQYIKFDLDDF